MMRRMSPSRYLVAITMSLALLSPTLGGQTATIQPIPKTGPLAASNGTNFKFVVAGDNRPATAKDPQPKYPGLIFAAAKRHGVAFVVWTGDTIVGLDSADPTAIGKQYQEYFALAMTAGVPVFVAPGNHEMNVKVKHVKGLKETGSKKMEALYRENMGLAKDAPIYGAFTYANSRFVLLNSEEVTADTVPRSPGADTGTGVNLDPGYISKEQLAWVTKELTANTAVHTFVFMHHPIKPKKPDMGLDKASADALVALFALVAKKRQNLSYVLASHEHLYYNPQGKTGIDDPPERHDPSTEPPVYLVSGGAGAPISAKPADGGFNHYLLVHVNGGHVKVEVHKL